MEFELPSMITLIFSTMLLYIVFKFLKSPIPETDPNRIPGPPKFPIIGNLHLLLGKTLPHQKFRDLAVQYGPLMELQLGGVTTLIVSSVDVARQVLKTHDVIFANRPRTHASATLTYGCSDIAFAPYGDHWRYVRKICTLELLSGRRVRQFRPIREEENASVVEWIASKEGSPVNLTEKIGLSAFDITSRASIGQEAEEKLEMAAAMSEAIKLGSGLYIADLYPSSVLLPIITGMSFKIRRIFRQMDRIFENIIIRHREAKAARSSGGAAVEGAEDLADILLKCQEDGLAEVRLTDDNIKAVILDMFLAGAETSATVVEWAISEMIRHPNTLERAQDEVRGVLDDKGYVDEEKFDELKYLKLVIKETMRLHPPVPLLVPRINSERCKINEYRVLANTRVMVNAWALGRDSKYWGDDAEKFKPERFEDSSIDFKGNNLEFIPFGAGRRMCPGMSFGMANVEITLATLLYHFNWATPTGIKNEDLDMTEELSSTARRKHALVLIPTVERPLVAHYKMIVKLSFGSYI